MAGFSNEAVVTLWAMFIISEGLLRTGVGDLMGRYVLRLAGRNEPALVAVIMLASGGMSAFMNNIGVAVLMLPVVMGLARRARVPPSRLLMPLSFGCLLGGLITQIGTPPNLLVSAALAEQGDYRFGLFDFLPVGGAALVAGVLFFVIFSRRLLPTREAGEFARMRSQRNLRALYGLRDFMFTVALGPGSALAGRTLAESRIAALGLIVIAIERGRRIIRLPARQTELRERDRLLVQGKREYIEELRAWQEVIARGEAVAADLPMTEHLRMVQARVAEGSPLIQNPVNRQELQLKTRGLAIALRRGDQRAALRAEPHSLARRRLRAAAGPRGYRGHRPPPGRIRRGRRAGRAHRAQTLPAQRTGHHRARSRRLAAGGDGVRPLAAGRGAGVPFAGHQPGGPGAFHTRSRRSAAGKTTG